MIVLLSDASFIYDFGEYEDLDFSILRIAVLFVDSSYLSSEAKPIFCMKTFLKFCVLIRFTTCIIKETI